MGQSEVKLNNKLRWKELTYKLIYPAFFGNMVYDFITFINESNKWHWPLIAATGFILFFYILDYVHLNVDLEHIVPEDKKDRTYIIADICVSLALFLAVAFVKFELPEVSVFFVCMVPILFAWYNTKLGYHPKFHNMYRLAAIMFLVAFVIIALIFHFHNATCYKHVINFCFLFVSVSLSAAYFWYNRNFFWSLDKPNLNE